MALTYNFYSDKNFQTEAVQSAIDSAAAKASPRSGISCVDFAMSPLDPYSIESIHRTFGFTPACSLLFRLDKFCEGDSAFEQLTRTWLALLEQGVQRAAMLFLDEATVFVFDGKSLFLNKSRHFWEDQDRVKLISTDFEIKQLPDPS